MPGEKGEAPAHIVAEHHTEGRTDNQRKLCPYPQKAVYVGPRGRENDPASWVERNFECR